MRYCETGINLVIDLSKNNIEKIETDIKDTELYLGGIGLNAKLLWEMVDENVDPLSEENVIIFGTGLLTGTLATGANRTIITSISPQTKLVAFSMMGGFWGPFLKFAGYDRLIIKGKADKLVYLYINNDTVEIRDASHLKGKGCYDTIKILKEEIKEKDLEILVIGPAGENKVYFASIESTKSSASRLGLGAVMGSKNLKAIVVKGTKDLYIKDGVKFHEENMKVLKFIENRLKNPLKGVMAIHAYLGAPWELKIDDEEWHTTNFSWGNARVRRKDFWNEKIAKKWAEDMRKARKRFVSCFNCPIACSALVKVDNYPESIMKCFSKLTYVFAAMVDDLDFGFKIASVAQNYGFDGYSTPQVIAFSLELLDAGILTKEDVKGLPDDKEGQFLWFLDKIAHREGIGDVLADGVYWAARKIGKGAEEFDHNTIKKHEQVPIKLGKLNPIYYLLWSTGEKINITQIEGQIPQSPLPKELAEEFVKDWIQIPTGKEERFKNFILEWEKNAKKAPFWPDIDLICELVEWQEIMHYIDDTLGICTGLSSFAYKPPYHIHNLPLFITYGTGIEYTEDMLWETAQRNRNLIRALNIIRGLRREDEAPPKDHWRKRYPEYEKELLDKNYEYRGWDKNGIPTKETLLKLKLDFVCEKLYKNKNKVKRQ